MSENLPKLFTTEFSTILAVKLQQRQSKLRGKVMEGNHKGKQASVIQYVGAIQMKTPAGRYAPIGRQDTDFSRRWVVPVDKDANQLIDTFDLLKTAIEPTSQYSDVAAAAVAREWDDRLIAAAFATALLGTGNTPDAFTTESFNTGSTVTGAGFQIPSTFGSSAASGLTVQKMIEAKRAFRKAQVDLETTPLTWVTNSQGESDLLNQVQITSNEFRAGYALEEGKVSRFLGFDIVYSERLVSDGVTRQNIPFAKDGLYLGIWKDTETDVDRRKDITGLPYQIYTIMSSGATRLEPGRLLQCMCADASAAADVTP